MLKPGGKLVLMENDMASWHVRLWEPAVRTVKRALGRPSRSDAAPSAASRSGSRRRRRPAREEDRHGLADARLRRPGGSRSSARFPSQFTELYTQLPTRALKRLVYRFNQAWFDRGGGARGAMGNVFVFQKS